MPREKTTDAVVNGTLKRRLRGYDRRQTEHVLAEAGEDLARVRAERDALSDNLSNLRREQEEVAQRFDAERSELKERLSDRKRRVVDLEVEVANFKEEQSKQAEEIRRLTDELSSARAAHDACQSELADQRESVARLEVREKALVEQLAMLEGLLHQEEVGHGGPALPHHDDRVAARLLRLDRVVETLERETRREAEVTLKKARERAEQILRAAEAQHRRLQAASPEPDTAEDREGEEYDPVAALERVQEPVKDPETSSHGGPHVGEAAWTSRPPLSQTTEQTG
jgi:hypothetical protein